LEDRSSTRYHNISIFNEMGFSQVSNSTVFRKKNKYILSPAVAENKNGRFWFDLREKNLEKINDDAILLVRIVPDLFAVIPIEDLSNLLQQQYKDIGPHSGGVWRMYLKINFIKDTVDIWTLRSKNLIKEAKLIRAPETVKGYMEILFS